MRQTIQWASRALCAAAALGACGAAAQAFPVKPVRIIVPFAPGGATDIVARLIQPKLSEHLGQTVVIDNRGGGGATIGMDMVAKAAADGHTLGVATLTFALNPSLRKLPYDSERDFAPVSLISVVPFVMMIHPSIPARNVKQLVAPGYRRAGGDAARGHPAPERRGRQDADAAGSKGALYHPRRIYRGEHARAARRSHQDTNGALGQGHQDRRAEAQLIVR